MDSVLLSRIQFGITAGFHFIFPPLSIGLIVIIFILETFNLKKQDPLYRNISAFLIKIFGLIFTVGVATGIVLEFSFGTNWSAYSRAVGDIFGAPLAAEAVIAFFLESVFLGVLLFGRQRVSPGTYWLSTLLVLAGSHLSGLWIIIANSWMQTPAGFIMTDGRAMLTDFFEAALNHSTLIRFTHTIMASWITGALFVSGISAWYVVKKRNLRLAGALLPVSLSFFIAVSFLQFVSGHGHAIQVAQTQPEKMAAFEALWRTQNGAPMSIFGIPDEASQTTRLEVSVPKLLSFLIHFDTSKEVKGLGDFPPGERPPVFLPYMSYHFMIGAGSYFALLSAIGVFLISRKRLLNTGWYLKLLIISIPVPIAANEAGWIAAEVGRQPWAIYRVLRTADAASVSVPAWQILLSIIMFSLIYALIFAVFMKLLLKIIREWSDSSENIAEGY